MDFPILLFGTIFFKQISIEPEYIEEKNKAVAVEERWCLKTLPSPPIGNLLPQNQNSDY